MKKVTPFLIVLFSALFLFSAIMLIKETRRQKEDQDNFEQLAELVAVQEPAPTQSQSTEEPSVPADSQPTRDLSPLFQRNKDCIGWLCIDSTVVNYPVMHTPKDPQKYLRKSFDLAHSTAGVPFMDGACTLQCDNLILYGHNMRNGTMFADVTKYKSKDYCEDHPVIVFETEEALKHYRVFAVVRLKSTDKWYSFHIADDEAVYDHMVAEIKDRALYDTGVTPSYGDQLITLSTCYGKKDDDRIIVIGAEMR